MPILPFDIIILNSNGSVDFGEVPSIILGSHKYVPSETCNKDGSRVCTYALLLDVCDVVTNCFLHYFTVYYVFSKEMYILTSYAIIISKSYLG